jgi:hypothetical protein
MNHSGKGREIKKKFTYAFVFFAVVALICIVAAMIIPFALNAISN